MTPSSNFVLNVPDSLIPEIQPKLHAALGDMVTAVATGYGDIDLIIPGVHKANGLRILQQRWGIEDHEVVAFGDSGNDIEMLQHAGFGFAMANAREDVKAVARYQAPHNNEEGVLQIIDKVLDREAPFADKTRMRAHPGKTTTPAANCRRFSVSESKSSAPAIVPHQQVKRLNSPLPPSSSASLLSSMPTVISICSIPIAAETVPLLISLANRVKRTRPAFARPIPKA